MIARNNDFPTRGDGGRPTFPSSPLSGDEPRPGRDSSLYDDGGCWDEGCYYSRPSQKHSADILAWAGALFLLAVFLWAVYYLVAAAVEGVMS